MTEAENKTGFKGRFSNVCNGCLKAYPNVVVLSLAGRVAKDAGFKQFYLCLPCYQDYEKQTTIDDRGQWLSDLAATEFLPCQHDWEMDRYYNSREVCKKCSAIKPEDE